MRDRQADFEYFERLEYERAVVQLVEIRKNKFIKLDFKEKDRLYSGVNYDVWLI